MIPWFGEEDQGRPSLIHAWTRRAYSLPSARRRTRGALRAWATQESLNRLGVVPWIFEPPLPQSSVPQAPIWSPYSKPPRTSYVVSLQFSRCGHLLGAASTSGAVTIYPFHLSEKVWDAASEMRKRVANVGLSDHDTFFDQLPRPPYASSSPGRVLWDDEAFENEYGPTGMKARFALMKQSAVSLRLLCEQELGYGHPSPLWRNPQASTGSLASYTQNNQQVCVNTFLFTNIFPLLFSPDNTSSPLRDSLTYSPLSISRPCLNLSLMSRWEMDLQVLFRTRSLVLISLRAPNSLLLDVPVVVVSMCMTSTGLLFLPHLVHPKMRQVRTIFMTTNTRFVVSKFGKQEQVQV